jgi:hypothetical protein
MVNNQIYIWVRLIVPIYLTFTLNVNGQNISKNYSSSIQNNGMLYFVFPQKGFENNKYRGKLTYDITYLTSKDTATLNFSYFEKSKRDIDSISFSNEAIKFSGSVKKIFIETNKLNWHYRYSTKVSFTDLNSFFIPNSNPKITIYSKQGDILLSTKQSDWIKKASKTKKILTLISLNK